MRNVLPVVFTLAVAALAPTVSGCYAEAELPPPAYGVGDERYEPQYYDGYVVYYDDYGRPYYYAEGRPVWVRPSSPVYVGLVDHWRVYRPAYHRWYGHYGHRYRTYRSHAHGYRR
jgi:hypothetical protein